jgi:hypothetical protein
MHTTRLPRTKVTQAQLDEITELLIAAGDNTDGIYEAWEKTHGIRVHASQEWEPVRRYNRHRGILPIGV